MRIAHPSEYGELFRRCNHCKTAEGPFQVCSNCKVALYCSREHQAAEWPHHKTVCNTIARTRRKVEVEVEEQTLREEEADFISPGNVENAVGDFWGIYSTRDYMRARFAYVDALRKVHNPRSVQAQHDYVMETLRICHSDRMGMRDLTPHLKLLLGRDQEAYDFVKWWGQFSASVANRGARSPILTYTMRIPSRRRLSVHQIS
jgi:MYND finger